MMTVKSRLGPLRRLQQCPQGSALNLQARLVIWRSRARPTPRKGDGRQAKGMSGLKELKSRLPIEALLRPNV